jgi:hypothetical protein
MRRLHALLAAAAATAGCALTGAAAFQSIEGTSAAISWQGRTYLNLEGGAPDGTVAFDWPGVRFAFTVTGSTWVTMSLPSNNTLTRLRVTVDGFDAGAFFASDSQTGDDYLLAAGLDAGSVHSVEVYNLVEPAFSGSKNFFMKRSLATLTTDGEFGAPPAPLTRSLEFIGDSLTVGFGSNGIKPCTGSALTEDNSVSWANLLCVGFRANCSITAWSGIGVYANSPNVQPPGTPTMPVLYTRSLGATGDAPSVSVCGAAVGGRHWATAAPVSGHALPSSHPCARKSPLFLHAQAWDFSRYTPDAVVINLGVSAAGSAAR